LTSDGDPFFVLADYAAYVSCQESVDALFSQPNEWTARAIANVAGMGMFSSDRTALEYARHVWNVAPLRP
jgi:starch phosphorylase